MNPRLAQTLAAIGVSLAVASTRWAWVLAFHRPHPRNQLTWTAPVLAGLLAITALGWAVWLFRAHPRAGGPVDHSGPGRWPPHQVDRAYSLVCCAIGGLTASFFISEMMADFFPGWFFIGPPMLATNILAPFRGWQPGPDRELFAIFVFVLYYHLLAAPGYALLSRSAFVRDDTRTRLLMAQWAFAAMHIALTALFAWLMQA